MIVVADTDPYPWPFDGNLSPDRLAVVVAGNDDHWPGHSVGSATVAATVEDLLAQVRPLGVIAVHVDHARARQARSSEREPRFRDSRRAVEVAAGDLAVEAAGIDGFFGSDLDLRLRLAQRPYLVFCGFGLEGPVHSTMRSANDRGYECLLLVDATGAADPVTGAAALSTVTMSGGIFGALGRVDDLRQALDPITSSDPARPDGLPVSAFGDPTTASPT